MSNTSNSEQKHGTDIEQEKGGRQGSQHQQGNTGSSDQGKGGQNQPGKGGQQDKSKGGQQEKGSHKR